MVARKKKHTHVCVKVSMCELINKKKSKMFESEPRSFSIVVVNMMNQ